MKTYRIKDWDKHYETAETRKLVSLRWLPIPNKHDGLGFRRITMQKDACELFTAWILILQVASKGRGPDERGNLLRGQEALGDEDLAMMTGFPKAIFTRALDFFSNPKQGWLLVHEDELPLSPAIPAESPASPASPPAVWNGMEGREGKEGNGKTEGADKPPRSVFVPPLPHEVETYSASIGYPMDGQAWCDSYAQKGWMVGRSKMKSWQAAVRNWKSNGWVPNKADKPNEPTRRMNFA